MNEFHEETYMFLGLLAFAAFGIWLLFRRHQLADERSRLDLELRNRLLEKFATAKEFLDFAETPEGRRILTVETAKPRSPYLTSVRFLQAGALSVLLGAAFLVNSHGLKPGADFDLVREAHSFRVWGTLFVMAGAGQMLAALISYLFAKSQRNDGQGA